MKSNNAHPNPYVVAHLALLKAVADERPLRTQAGAILREARTREDLTQFELAERLGINVRTLQRWEADDSTASLAQLDVVARALGLRLHLAFTPAAHPAK